MWPDLRKIWVVASAEFGTAVRTKAFLVGLLGMPAIVGLSIGIQHFAAGRIDARTRTFAVVDETGTLTPSIEAAVKGYNDQSVDSRGQLTRPRLQMEKVDPGLSAALASLELSDRIRSGQLDAYAIVPAEAVKPPAAGRTGPLFLEYHSDNPNDEVVRNWLLGVVNAEIRMRRFRAAGLDEALVNRLNQAILLDNRGLVQRAAAPVASTSPGEKGAGRTEPEITAAEKVDPVRTVAVPMVLVLMMFMLVMTTTPHLLNSALEEKMSKISEVLLGSVTPFELMMGKLLGFAAIGMVLATFYVGGGCALAAYHGYADVISVGILASLALFLVLALLMFGSMFMAVGAACEDMKDAQSLMMPVLLLVMLPMMFWIGVLKNPTSSLSVGISLFPPASPFLMLMRMVLRPAPPAWQVALAIVGTVLTTILCVWAAAKVFRTGILMQGKTPSYREIIRWVMAR